MLLQSIVAFVPAPGFARRCARIRVDVAPPPGGRKQGCVGSARPAPSASASIPVSKIANVTPAPLATDCERPPCVRMLRAPATLWLSAFVELPMGSGSNQDGVLPTGSTAASAGPTAVMRTRRSTRRWARRAGSAAGGTSTASALRTQNPRSNTPPNGAMTCASSAWSCCTSARMVPNRVVRSWTVLPARAWFSAAWRSKERSRKQTSHSSVPGRLPGAGRWAPAGRATQRAPRTRSSE